MAAVEPLREIANKPQSATATNDEADKKCVDSSFSTMGIVLGIRVKEGWKDRGGGRVFELVGSAWLSFIFKHIEKQLKSKQSE